MLLIEHDCIVGNTAPNIYGGMKPWTHPSGAAWWIVQAGGSPFVDSDGQTYTLHKRTQAELEATAEYLAWRGDLPAILPIIYVHVLLSTPILDITAEDAVIQFTAELKASDNSNAADLPIDDTWPINLRNKNGHVIDNILATFTQGACLYAYRYQAGLPLGEYRLDEADFDTVTYAGTTYQVKLAAPVRFTITRTLLEV